MNNDSAFPFEECRGQSLITHPGLTKRELFAAMAMQGFCSDSEFRAMICNGKGFKKQVQDGQSAGDICAGLAVEYADALIKELEKK